MIICYDVFITAIVSGLLIFLQSILVQTNLFEPDVLCASCTNTRIEEDDASVVLCFVPHVNQAASAAPSY